MKAVLSFPGCHRRAGVERIMFECARHLASQGHDVTVFANEWEEDDTQHIKYHYVPMQKQPFFLAGTSYFRECTKALRDAEYDVLNTHGSICPLGGVQWVQSIQRAWLEQSKKMRSPLSLSRIRQQLNPLHPVLLGLEDRHFRERNYQKLIATTPQVKADLNRLYGVPEEDVVIIPNGFSPTEFNPKRRAERRQASREQLGLKPNHVALLFVANELERKGYHTILAALSLLKGTPEGKNLRLLVVGRPAKQLVLQHAAELSLEDQVISCGTTQDVSAFHAASDLFVLPTQYEAFCLAILEALGSGLPVVTTKVPGAQDAIRPGENGFLIDDPHNGEHLASILKLLSDDGKRAEISNQAPGTVEEYQWPRVLSRYESVLCQYANAVSRS
jgi:UDP-glucose:(heptosyl)LPS alpha-1,3-glucosyltransferase